ncbi:MAG: hypothetical protein ABFC77_00870 [Thermoguttaceae bacterium]
MKRIVVLHNAVPADAPPEDFDTLVQADAIMKAIGQLGHEPLRLSCTLDLSTMIDQLREIQPDLVFNLVEALADFDALAHLPIAVLEAFGIPHTGSSAESFFLTTHKVLAKRRLRLAGLPTPAWIEGSEDFDANQESLPAVGSWILKGVCDQGSRDMDDDAVLRDVRPVELQQRMAQRSLQSGRPCFAEQFIDGREFAIAMLAGPHGPETLPPSEIQFNDFPSDKPKIVGYRAKWIEGCFEYDQTPRHFTFTPEDEPLLNRLRDLAKRCWEYFHLHGWARVDFRVDSVGNPWILEVNANPCLAPEAGFAMTLHEASIPFADAVERILKDPV